MGAQVCPLMAQGGPYLNQHRVSRIPTLESSKQPKADVMEPQLLGAAQWHSSKILGGLLAASTKPILHLPQTYMGC